MLVKVPPCLSPIQQARLQFVCLTRPGPLPSFFAGSLKCLTQGWFKTVATQNLIVPVEHYSNKLLQTQHEHQLAFSIRTMSTARPSTGKTLIKPPSRSTTSRKPSTPATSTSLTKPRTPVKPPGKTPAKTSKKTPKKGQDKPSQAYGYKYQYDVFFFLLFTTFLERSSTLTCAILEHVSDIAFYEGYERTCERD